MTNRPHRARLPSGASFRGPLEGLMERNLAEHACYLQRGTPGMVVRETDDLLIADSGMDNDSFNFVGAARFTEENALDRIAVTIAGLEVLERPFAWRVGPASTPPGLAGLLTAAGLPATETEPAMYLWLAGEPASSAPGTAGIAGQSGPAGQSGAAGQSDVGNRVSGKREAAQHDEIADRGGQRGNDRTRDKCRVDARARKERAH